MTNECSNCKSCNYRVQKIMKKLRKEIRKADKLIEKYSNYEKTSIYDKPSENEKRKIIDSIKMKSSAYCGLFEELKIHKIEVKYLLEESNTLIEKYEKLKIRRKEQMEQVQNISCFLNNALQLMGDVKTTASLLEWNYVQRQGNNKLHKTFNNITSECTSILKNFDIESKTFKSYVNSRIEENNQDKIIFSIIVRFINKTFEMLARLECKEACVSSSLKLFQNNLKKSHAEDNVIF